MKKVITQVTKTKHEVVTMSIENIKNNFEAMKATKATNTKKTKKEIIEELADDIRALRKQGFSFAAILEVIKSNGESMTESTLKQYLKGARKPKKAKKPGRPSSAKASSAPQGKQSHPAPRPAQAERTPLKPVTRTDGSFNILSDDDI